MRIRRKSGGWLWWLTPVIPATLRRQNQEDQFQGNVGKYLKISYLGKSHQKKGLVEWLKA
jgi:hypothetical protein